MPFRTLFAASLAASALSLSAQLSAQLPGKLPALVPAPREIRTAALVPVASAIVIAPGAEDLFTAQDLTAALNAEGISAPGGTPALTITLLRTNAPAAIALLRENQLSFEPAMHDEGYILLVHPTHAELIADTPGGLFYAAQTLKQLVIHTAAGPQVFTATVRDWPAMKYRGVHDDLSRGPFPTLAFQKHQIATLAAFKVNLYSPYFEHTLQYAADPLAAPPGSSLTRAEAQELAAYAAQYHVTIVPEQEAFGHLHHLLKFEKYSGLAETPHGHVLAPGESGTQPLIRSWFTQIAEDFPSPFLHVGADETFELGTGRTRPEVEKRGLGPVYADFLSQIHTTLAPLHRRLLFWGDVAESDPSAIGHLPKDMIAIPWIYWHKDSYDGDILPFKKAGMETWVAPGDANWKVVYPLGKVALDNIRGFVESGQRLGSTGMLLAVWNDDGEGLFNQDWFGVLFGAAAGWQPAPTDPIPFERAFGHTFFGDDSGKIDQAQQELLAAEDLDVSDDAFWIDPWSAAGQALNAKLRPKIHAARLHAERALELLHEVRTGSPNLRELNALAAMELGARRIDFIGLKFQLSDEMSEAYARAYAIKDDPKKHAAAADLLDSISSMNGRCQDLRDGYSQLKNLYASSWLAENRPYWLDNVLVRYDLRIQLWQSRADQIDTLVNTWEDTKHLPALGEAGLPPLAPQP